MQTDRLAIATAAVIGLGVPGVAAQGEPMGTIDGTINGEAAVWRTLDVPAEGTATAEIRTAGPVTMVTIQGHREGESIMRHILSLEFSVMNGEPMGAPQSATFPRE